jgi:hypothetical protein
MWNCGQIKSELSQDNPKLDHPPRCQESDTFDAPESLRILIRHF